MIVVIGVLGLIFVPMIVETRLASRNERAQRARGGLEPVGDVYKIMQVAYPGAFAVMIAEAAMRGGPTAAVFAAGCAVFVAAKTLKWWAIHTLGAAWTFRVIVVPGARRIRSGPYRHLPHPNYVAVAGELVGTALMTGARISGPVATVMFALLILKRISVESRALESSLAAPVDQRNR